MILLSLTQRSNMTKTKRTTRSMTRSKASASAARAKRRVQKPAVSLLERCKRIIAQQQL